MSNKQVIIGALALVVVAVGITLFLTKPQQGIVAGGTVAGTRTSYTTIDGNTGSSTVNGISGIFINPSAPSGSVATSTLIASDQGVDNASFFATVNASSSATVEVGVQFQESMDTTCTTNSASTTWYALTPINVASLAGIQQLATTTTYVWGQTSSSTVQGFVVDLPEVPAQCIRASVFAQPGTTNFQVWYGFGSTRNGYNNSN